MSTDPVAAPSRPAEPADSPLPGYRDLTWAQAAGQRELAAPLDRLPDGLIFPADFPEPIHYDAGQKLLHYRGMMYHGSYAFLRDQSRDLHYLAAVDQLYQLSAAPRKHWPIGMLATAITASVAVALTLVWMFGR